MINPDELYCPLCGLSAGGSEFYTPEVLRTAEERVENLDADLLNDFSRDLERRFRSKCVQLIKYGR